jgi:hypothetical protein
MAATVGMAVGAGAATRAGSVELGAASCAVDRRKAGAMTLTASTMAATPPTVLRVVSRAKAARPPVCDERGAFCRQWANRERRPAWGPYNRNNRQSLPRRVSENLPQKGGCGASSGAEGACGVEAQEDRD